MRSSLILIGLALVPVFTYWLRWHYANLVLPKLTKQARTELIAAGLGDVNLELNYFDAKLTGYLQDPDSRDDAEKLVERLPGIRVPPGNNLISVAARLTYVIHNGEVRVRGWLPDVEKRNAMKQMVEMFRPDLKVVDNEVRISPHVELGKPVEMAEGPVPASFQELLEALRVPASLSIKRDGDKFILKGMLQSENLRKKVIAAAASSGWELDSSQLRWNKHCGAAPFNTGDGLPRFVEALFNSPSPGEFEVDVRSGPRVRAHCTAGTEAVWLGLLRPVSGEARVQMDITRVPSPFHFPDYKPTSKLPEGMTKPMQALLKHQTLYFEIGLDQLMPSQTLKAGGLVAAVMAAGPDARFVIAGYGDNALEPGSTGKLRAKRVEYVRNQLVKMGAPAEHLETSVFEAVRPPGPITDEVRQEARKVELLLK